MSKRKATSEQIGGSSKKSTSRREISRLDDDYEEVLTQVDGDEDEHEDQCQDTGEAEVVKMAVYWKCDRPPYFCDHKFLWMAGYKGAHVDGGFISKLTASKMVDAMESSSTTLDKMWRKLFPSDDRITKEYRSAVFSDFVGVFGRELRGGEDINSSVIVARQIWR